MDFPEHGDNPRDIEKHPQGHHWVYLLITILRKNLSMNQDKYKYDR